MDRKRTFSTQLYPKICLISFYISWFVFDLEMGRIYSTSSFWGLEFPCRQLVGSVHGYGLRRLDASSSQPIYPSRGLIANTTRVIGLPAALMAPLTDGDRETLLSEYRW